ncbi:MAG: molybdopterin cofactor-binding domain-containing protein, partial [Caulobacteraceae bacterium]
MSSVADYALPNPVNQNRAGTIGRPVDRYEGPLKVSGTAPYAYEVKAPSPPAYGVIVGAEIGFGELVIVEDVAARSAPGVLMVWHPFDPPPNQGEAGAKAYVQSQAAAEPVFATKAVRYFGQPVALVVADTFENAVAAGRLVRFSYREAAEPDFVFDPMKAGPSAQDHDSRVGDFEAAFETAPVKLDEVYSTPIQNHCQMEPCATTAWWEDDTVVVHASIQMIKRPQHLLAETLMIDRGKVHLLSRYIGGGFGGKGSVYEDFALAALAARDLKRPVKIALTRQQMFNAT